MGKMTLILGGARSGKSTHAQTLAREDGGSVTFIATAQAGDAEMAERITTHQHERPDTWVTMETPLKVAAAWRQKKPQTDLVILDCITFLVTNLLLQASEDLENPDEITASALVAGEIDALVGEINNGTSDWIIVTNEVGLGLVPPYPLGRVFRDLLGWANQRLATNASEIYWLIAGIPMPIHNFRKS